MKRAHAITILMTCMIFSVQAQKIFTVAGNGVPGFSGDGGAATASAISFPQAIVFDASSNLYFADGNNKRIRKIDTNNVITTVVGNGSTVFAAGPALSTGLNVPTGLAIDSHGDVYITDAFNNAIRKLTVATGIVSTYAGTGGGGYSGDGGPAVNAQLNFPRGICFDNADNLYIADNNNMVVRKVTPGGVITTVAGTGGTAYNGDGIPATSATLNFPSGVAVDAAGNFYIADNNHYRVRKVDVSTGIISTIAGTGSSAPIADEGGPATSGTVAPTGLKFDVANGLLYVGEEFNNRVRVIDLAAGTINTIAGTTVAGYNGEGILATLAQLSAPVGVGIDNNGHLYIAEANNNRLRIIADPKPFITTWKTDNPGVSASNQITIPTTGISGNYNVYWEEVGVPTNNGNSNNLSGAATITFPSAGTYRVEITGTFLQIFFEAQPADSEKILTVEQWGSTAWSTMEGAFWGCSNLRITAADVPQLGNVTNMDNMFIAAKSFNDDIGNWDVSHVTSMRGTFNGATSFNQDISAWDVSHVTDMSLMFYEASAFNQAIGNWDVSQVTRMYAMFQRARAFNQDIGLWDVGQVTTMVGMFQEADLFNQDIGNWDVSNVTEMIFMFNYALVFNGDIGDWDVSKVTNMSYMFGHAPSFNQDIGAWNVSQVTGMGGMFLNASSFNQDIGSWDTGLVTDMSVMFQEASSFNQDIGSWNVSQVTAMNWMFRDAESFNQDIGAWDVSKVTLMFDMFFQAKAFNQDIGSWDVSQVTNMNSMFSGASAFNQDISNWNVGNVTTMGATFLGANSFNQNIGNWDISHVTSMVYMLADCSISQANYDAILTGWASQAVQPGVPFGAYGLMYCNAAAARAILTGSPNNWIIDGDILHCAQGILKVSVSSLDKLNGSSDLFPTTTVGGSATHDFILSNTGDAPLAISSIASTGDYSITSSIPSMIDTSGTSTIKITFSPSASGTRNGTVVINNDGPVAVFTINLSGTGQITLPTFTVVVDGTSKANASTVDFSSLLLGQQKSKDFAISNTSTVDLTISNITTTGDYTITSAIPSTLNAGATVIIPVRFSPSAAGASPGVLTINSNASTPLFTLNLAGTGIQPAPIIDLNVEGTPVLTGTQVHFPTTGVGVDIEKSIVIQNIGTAPLIITDIQVSGDFTLITAIPPPIPVNEQAIISILFAPTDLGERTGTISIFSNGDVPVYTINISGEGDAEPEVYNVVTVNPNGKHDFLKIRNITLFPNNVVNIYDRWGNHVFEKQNYDNVEQTFAGVGDDNKPLPEGTYYYVIDKGNGGAKITGFLLLRK